MRRPPGRPMDFVHDRLAVGCNIRLLTVVYTFSRFSPVVDPSFSYRFEQVVATLEKAWAKVGHPGRGVKSFPAISIYGPMRRG